MDKSKKYFPTPHDKRERIGEPTGLLDCNRNEIMTGDMYGMKGTNYSGPIMWHRSQKCYGMFLDCCYLDYNPMNPDCYGKFIKIPKDNGMRMELIPIINK